MNNPSNRCLICQSNLVIIIGWAQLFSKDETQTLCKDCTTKFEEIVGERCRICDRSSHHYGLPFKEGICYDCERWEKDPEWSGYLHKNESLFYYNDFLKEVLAKFKYRGDYQLSYVFSSYLKAKLTRAKFDILTPIPLSTQRQYERGFNQAEALIVVAGFKPILLLNRAHTEKQSKKSRSDRIHLPQVFSVLPDIGVKGQNILLIDDIYTTGSTLRHAAKVLKEAGAVSVASLTLARG
jgi:competence protein ComFC